MTLDPKRHPFLLFFPLAAVVLIVLFRGVFSPDNVLFSNDGPLGAQNAEAVSLPSGFTGIWYDLNSVGYNGGAFSPTLTNLVRWWLGPLNFSRFYVPLVILFLGCSAWLFFARLRLAPLACLAGGLAAMFNSGFFSAAAWGVGPQAVCFGFNFLALAAVTLEGRVWNWLKYVLAGFCVGVGVMEGADVGAIFSMLVAAFVFYRAIVADSAAAPVKVLKGITTTALVAVAAGFIAAQTLEVLISTQIKGVAGTEQDTQTKEQRWDWATQWSLPKREALGLIVPGLFGYRMDTPDGGNYWGAVGRDPNWDRYFAKGKEGPPPGGFLRFTGGGIYAGVLVVIVAIWTMLRGLPRSAGLFPAADRKYILFWSVLAGIGLLLAFGRFAPFYWFLYQLPYFSTIRNPAKWIHVCNWSLIILFAYGVDGLWRTYMRPAQAGSAAPGKSLGAWWAGVQGFDRRWTVASVAALVLAVGGWLAYAQNRGDLVSYLQGVGFSPEMAQEIAPFSIHQVAWFVLSLAVALGLLALVMSGRFYGPRANLGAVAIAAFLVIDFARANQPWIVIWNYKEKYASNPIVDSFREKAYQHRVGLVPEWLQQATDVAEQGSLLNQLYRIEWAQHHFLYYNIQSIDIVQMSRMPADLKTFEEALQPRTMADVIRLVPRRWQLTNTRYLLGPASCVEILNKVIDPQLQRFKVAEPFRLTAKPGVTEPRRLEELTAVPATNGPYTIIEFTGALPRAKLYSDWQVVTDTRATFSALTNSGIDLEKTVILNEEAPLPTGATNEAPGSVETVSYSSKHFHLKADARRPSVLLLNDRFDPNWTVTVDGKPAKVMRANYLMRAVLLEPGQHQVQFRFKPPTSALYVSLAAIGIALALTAFLLVTTLSRKDPGQK